VPTLNNRLPHLQNSSRWREHPGSKIPLNKNSNKTNNKQKPKNRQARRTVLTNQTTAGPSTGKPVNRVRGQAQICELTCDEPRAVYIDAIYLSNPDHSVPILKANFGLYEKYFVNNVRLEFVPTQPVTVGGTVGFAPDYDPLDPMPATRSALSTSQGYKTGPITSRLICEMPNYKGPGGSYVRPDLFCAPTNDDRLTSYGQFKCFAEAASLSKGDVVGRLVLHYDITFHILEPSTEVYYNGGTDFNKLTAVGTATKFMPTDIRSTTLSDALEMQDAAGNPVNLDASNILTAILDDKNLSMVTVAGKNVNPGTRVYFKPVTGNIATTTYTNLDSNSYVGGMSLSKNFDQMSNIIMSLTNGSFNTFLEAMVI